MPVDDRERKTAWDIDLYEHLIISMNQMDLYESNGSLFTKWISIYQKLFQQMLPAAHQGILFKYFFYQIERTSKLTYFELKKKLNSFFKTC